ncbi:MAG: UDP-N-acetylmuramate dehydrogenase [Thermodesulfovibrionales bacterium]|nr:UDP-N-acetylmuramate dehydrogenase [Thermodesulfovibrionales bacterium]
MPSNHKNKRPLLHFLDSQSIDYDTDVLLSKYSYVRIGGPADLFISPKIHELPPLMMLINQLEIPYHILGGGTNTLFDDEGFRGVVISLKNIKGLYHDIENNALEACGGEGLQRIVFYAERYGLGGVERLAGIPGSIGGAIKGNAGAFDMAISDVLQDLELVDIQGQVSYLKRQDILFSYRQSGIPKDCVITKARIMVTPQDKDIVKEKTRQSLRQKRLSQPVSQRSLGCVFKNPQGHFAGRLIDEAGCKGMSVGGIVVSHKHANFFINVGNGTSSDYKRLIDKIRERVFKTFGISLELEIEVVSLTT